MPYREAAELAKNPPPAFDFVICGGGTAASVMANRLSEPDANGKKHSVLVIEAGKAPRDLHKLQRGFQQTPALFAPLLTMEATAFVEKTVAQPNCGDRNIIVSRPKMLGGSANANAMIHNRSSRYDFTEAEEVDAAEELAKQVELAAMKPYFDLVDAKLHRGTDTHVSQLMSPFLQTAGRIHSDLAPQTAPQHPPTAGAHRFNTYVKNGERSSPQRVYLSDDIVKRSNLVIVTEARVDKLEWSPRKTTQPLRVEKVYLRVSSGQKYVVTVQKDVILAAGALNTPQILQRSGVGRHSVLEPLQIPQSINLPIGENLCDHLQYAVTWQVQDKKSLQGILSSSMFKEALKSLKNHNDFAKSTASSQNTAQNNSKDNGLKMSSNIGEAGLFIQSNHPLFAENGIHTNTMPLARGTTAPDIELVLFPLSPGPDLAKLSIPPFHDCMEIHVINENPASRGYVHIKSTDPFDAPIINPNYLDDENDVKVMVKGARLALLLASQDPLKAHVTKLMTGGPWHPKEMANLPESQLDKILEDDIRRRAGTIWHFVGTVALDKCVHRESLLLGGSQNVRVCDASIIPRPMAGHPQAWILAHAQKASEIILGYHAPQSSDRVSVG